MPDTCNSGGDVALTTVAVLKGNTSDGANIRYQKSRLSVGMIAPVNFKGRGQMPEVGRPADLPMSIPDRDLP